MTIAQLFSDHNIYFEATALALVALLGYAFGRRTPQAQSTPTEVTLLIEFARAQSVAKDLEHLAQRLRTETNGQLAAIAGFQGQVEAMQRGATAAEWRHLRLQADALMGPTMALASSLSVACDEIRDHQSRLMTFAEARVDRETGVLNRRALVEHLQARLSTPSEGKKKVSLVLCSIDVDPYAEALDGDDQLVAAARLIEQYARGNDLVARYGPQEFAVLLPRTTLEGSLIVGERILKVIDASLERRSWAGVVEAEVGELSEELLARADAALRAAARAEVATLFLHDGAAARRHPFELPIHRSHRADMSSDDANPEGQSLFDVAN